MLSPFCKLAKHFKYSKMSSWRRSLRISRMRSSPSRSGICFTSPTRL
ncbi:hypothetical protein PanWU01x14_166970 [Parasponia andersonii]|uniref:Uncharacterized protein n=1 Tax=Parasponia andersonii TaxID=3476 RepID=A0A2P5CBD2_PARAD|nr:hypothetical protein PanWU01x14_166970 [Parasponia andersonii]